MASRDQLAMSDSESDSESEVKIEIDVAEELGPEWVTRDRPSHKGDTSDLPGIKAETPVTRYKTSPGSPGVGNIKSELVEDADTRQDLSTNNVLVDNSRSDTDFNVKSEPLENADICQSVGTEPVVQGETSDVSSQGLSEAAVKTERKVAIKNETRFYVDFGPTSLNSMSASNPEHNKTCSADLSTEKHTPFLCKKFDTGSTSTDVKSEPVPKDSGGDVQTTEAVTDTMVRGTQHAVRSDSISSVDEDQDMPADDDQRWDEPSSACEVSRLHQPAASVLASARGIFKDNVHCETSSPVSCALKRHIVIHSGRLACGSCGKMFTHQSNLIRHRKLHTDERPFVCDICRKSFNRLGNLKRHKMVHTDQRPFVCEECDKSFTHARNLEAHKVVHTDERSFVCHVCNKSFAHARNLTTHKLLHSNPCAYRPIVCDVCGKTFTRASSLKAHMMTHTGERPFVCDVCDMAFGMSGTLKRHKKIHIRGKKVTSGVGS